MILCTDCNSFCRRLFRFAGIYIVVSMVRFYMAVLMAVLATDVPRTSTFNTLSEDVGSLSVI